MTLMPPGEIETGSRKILAIDTSSHRSSYAISANGKIIASMMSEVFIPHSKTFFDNIENLLRLSGLVISEIDVFAAATGPGSFTGLRVGLAAIQGLADALNKPAYGVGSIDCIALACGVTGQIAVMIEAGKGEIYFGLRLIDAQGGIHSSQVDRCLKPEMLLSELKHDQLIFAGDGAIRHAALISQAAERNGAEFLISNLSIPAQKSWSLRTDFDDPAKALARYIQNRLRKNEIPDPIHACYIRPSDAEINWSAHDGR
ncbi:MAG: tRNA (adenosine(37)-N6)-threonylcarbamoyltransferase complex dimerization subunit type 1 TsaB [Acidobacteria bacterium]|nr:tRNA (adenosine(37)-N6)-threonylcarbamoyltransferase complex dimerization subunit type 1 TsaB [Acidobacteriota bacterium]